MDNRDEEDGPWQKEESSFKPDSLILCDSPNSIGALAALRVGITCQKLFERAYARLGYPASYSRAVFVLYTDKSATRLPPIVLAECLLIAKEAAKPTTRKSDNKEVRGDACVACMVKREAWPGLVMAYRFIHPAVTKDALLAQAEKYDPAKHDVFPQKTRMTTVLPKANGIMVVADEPLNGNSSQLTQETMVDPVAKEDPELQALFKQIVESGALDDFNFDSGIEDLMRNHK